MVTRYEYTLYGYRELLAKYLKFFFFNFLFLRTEEQFDVFKLRLLHVQQTTSELSLMTYI